MKNKLLVGAVTLGAIGAIAATAVTTYAFNPDIKDALDNQDYSSWVEAIGETPKGEEMLELINESNFDQLIEAQNLREAGDFEGAKAIAEELGIDEIMKRGQGQNGEKMEAVKDALDAEDYNAWVEAMGDGEKAQKILDVINESNFDRLVEAHNLMQESKEIMEELGLPGPGQGERKGNFGPGGDNQDGPRGQFKIQAEDTSTEI